MRAERFGVGAVDVVDLYFPVRTGGTGSERRCVFTDKLGVRDLRDGSEETRMREARKAGSR